MNEQLILNLIVHAILVKNINHTLGERLKKFLQQINIYFSATCSNHFVFHHKSSQKKFWQLNLLFKSPMLPPEYTRFGFCGKLQHLLNSFSSLNQIEENISIKCCSSSYPPLTPMSDQEKISPYNINPISSRQVMRIKKDIIQGIIS